jgi:signal transduction histidine kinase
VFLSLVAIAIGTSVRNRRLHVAALVDRANALAVEREQGAQLAAAAERARIAREMHDVVAHSLSVMIALADGAGAALDRAPDRAREALDELSGTGRAALADMRRVLGALRDPGAPTDPGAPLDPQPGSLDLGRLVERFRTAGVPVRWTSTGPPLPPDAGLQLAVYRIVQESLTNVLRHAPGSARVEVVVASAPGRVDVTVTDAGSPAGGSGGAGGAAGTGSAAGSGRGLIGMRERAAVYGGRVEAGPHDGGWRVHAALTWDGEAA